MVRKILDWTASMPQDIHPRGDITGKNCGNYQNGPVWFLNQPVEVSTKKGIYCEIPAGKAIFVPLQVGECDKTVLRDPTDQEISICAKNGNQPGNIDFAIDGKPLVVIKELSMSKEQYRLYRTTTDFFNITFVKDNIFENATSGVHRAQADGYFAIVKPLPLGDHSMTLKINVFLTRPDPETHIDVSFNIKVVNN